MCGGGVRSILLLPLVPRDNRCIPWKTIHGLSNRAPPATHQNILRIVSPNNSQTPSNTQHTYIVDFDAGLWMCTTHIHWICCQNFQRYCTDRKHGHSPVI